MKKLGLSLLAICCSFILVNQASANCGGCGNNGLVYHDQCIDTCKEYSAGGCCVTTCPVKKYRAVNYCTTKYYQEPYCVNKTCYQQVPQYYEKCNVRYVPEYYKTTHCRYVSQPYTVQETKYRTKSYQERHVAYQPYITYKTFSTPSQNEEPCAQQANFDCGAPVAQPINACPCNAAPVAAPSCGCGR